VQPDEGDGELVFKTPLGRLRRNDFPFGRGVYVRRGSFVRVQCAVVGWGRCPHCGVLGCGGTFLLVE